MPLIRRSRLTFAAMGILATAALLGVVASLIPDDSYLRYQLLSNTLHASVPWIFERVHFDKKPIDVVFFGSSRTWLGVSPVRLEQDLSRDGLTENVVNFSMPQEGRNINYVIVKEIFKAERRPKLIVLGVVEKPQRFGHPAFKYVADTSDVVEPGYLTNVNYFPDVSYLPFRQLKLAAMWMLPNEFNAMKRFDPNSYEGSTYDTTISDRFLPAGFLNRGAVLPRATLLDQVAQWEKRLNPPLLPSDMAYLEFGDEFFYIRKIAALAETNGAKIAFLFIPYFNGPRVPVGQSFYEKVGPVLNADFVVDQDQLYSDFAHMNRAGAIRLTDWLSDRVAPLLRNDQESK